MKKVLLSIAGVGAVVVVLGLLGVGDWLDAHP